MFEGREDIKHALYGGVISGVTIGLPFFDLLNCACCAGVMLGGFLAVFFHTRESRGAQMSKADAIQMGVLSGLFGAAVGTMMYAFVLLVAGDVMLEMMAAILQDGSVREMLPPEFGSALDEMIRSEEGFSVFDILLHLLLWVIIAPLFGLIGSLIGYSVLKRDAPPSPTVLPPPTGLL